MARKKVEALSNFDTYLLYIGRYPGDVEREETYEIQTRGRGGKYRTRFKTKRRAQAYFHYQSFNIGSGYAKRLVCDGTVMELFSLIGDGRGR